MTAEKSQPEQQIALQFAYALAQRDYLLAYDLTTHDYRQQTSIQQMQHAFEHIIPNDWGPMELIEVESETLEDWPAKQPSDVGWVYISLVGDVYPYGEGLFILISWESGKLGVRDVEFGRP